MSTPSIQTLITQAQQVLNLKSTNEIRATLAAVLANANVGTPLNPNLTTQQLWDEFYEIVRQPSDDIMSIVVDQMMRMVFSPPAPGGAGANHEVIYNNNGVLAGDTKFLWDDALNKLDIDGSVTAGSATITGDLTVDTSTLKVDSVNNRVGINKASPAYALDVVGNATISATAGNNNWFYIAGNGNTVGSTSFDIGQSSSNEGYVFNRANGPIIFGVNNTTAMTLNATGLGVGASPSYKLDVAGQVMRLVSPASTAEIFLTDSGTTNGYVRIRGESNALKFVTGNGTSATIDSSGNVGIGVTPSAWGAGLKALQVGATGYGALFDFNNDVIAMSANLLWTGSAYNRISASSKYALAYYQDIGGSHQWSMSSAAGTNAVAPTMNTLMTLNANGNLVLKGGTAAANGVGVTFPATQVASSDANTLDDYEEGTWTGTIGGTTGNPTTPLTATGRYTKIGRQVHVEIGFYGDTTGASGRITVSGLPFTSNASIARPGAILMDTMGTFTGSPVAFLGSGVTSLDLYASNSNGAISSVTHNTGAGRALYMELTYTV